MQEELVTPRQAAESLFVTVGMIGYWIKKGRLKKHPLNGRNYLVDLNEARLASKWRERLFEELPENLVTPAYAAKSIGVGVREIGYYAKMGYIQKHYVLGNDHHYLVDLNEVSKQPDRIYEMYRSEERKDKLRKIAKSQPRDKSGRLFVATASKQ